MNGKLSVHHVLFAALGLIGAAAAGVSVSAQEEDLSRGDTITGHVNRVLDGDTLEIGAHRLRLNEVDAPEKAQPYGTEAAALLKEMVGGARAVATVQTIDRWGRAVVSLRSDRLDEAAKVADGPDLTVNQAMVLLGGAHVYDQYAKDKRLDAFEADAREAKRGLWALPESQRTPPWIYRACKAKRSSCPSHLQTSR